MANCLSYCIVGQKNINTSLAQWCRQIDFDLSTNDIWNSFISTVNMNYDWSGVAKLFSYLCQNDSVDNIQNAQLLLGKLSSNRTLTDGSIVDWKWKWYPLNELAEMTGDMESNKTIILGYSGSLHSEDPSQYSLKDGNDQYPIDDVHFFCNPIIDGNRTWRGRAGALTEEQVKTVSPRFSDGTYVQNSALQGGTAYYNGNILGCFIGKSVKDSGYEADIEDN